MFGLDAYDMSLVPDVTKPPKFKVPDFERYNGLSCPRNHLVTFCQKMASYAHNDKLLIHYFYDSLCEASFSLYMSLQRSCIWSWKDLS